MKSLHDYGALLLGSRLRKLSEALYAGVDEVYRDRGVPLPARCFPILFLLRDHGRLGISDLAQRLGQSHPAVSQMSRKLFDHGVVREWPDPDDERRRLLGLSPRGAALMRRLAPVWQAIVAAVEELESAHPLSAALTGADGAIERRGFASRIRSHLDRAKADAVRIVDFEPRYGEDFRRLNIQWLQKYFKVEPIDEVVLSRPGAIVDEGGCIVMARLGSETVGTCALLKKGQNRFELSKMAVAETRQGLGIGRRLMAAAIEAFESRGGGELFLETNSRLAPAIRLYETSGFVHAARPAGPAVYARSDVYMVYQRPHGAAAGAGCGASDGTAPSSAKPGRRAPAEARPRT